MRGVKAKMLRGIARGYSKVLTSYVGQIRKVQVHNPHFMKDGDLRPFLTVERLQVRLHPQCGRRTYKKVKAWSPPGFILRLPAADFYRSAKRPNIQVFDTKAEALAAQQAAR